MSAPRMGPLLCGFVAALLAGTGAARAGTVYVDRSNESGVEDGTPEHPFNTIQEGIDAAVQDDKVAVAPGIYKETVLMADGVSVLGAGWRSTTIDAFGLQASAVSFDATRLGPVLSGFTITGGAGDVRGDIGGVPIRVAGGILIIDSSPVIRDNHIVRNVVNVGYCMGGGIYVQGQASQPTIRGNVIADNVASSSTIPGGSGRGGGIYVSLKNAGATIEDNVIEANVSVEGGGVYLDNEANAAVVFARNRVEANQAAFGGGLWLRDSDGSATQVRNNLFVGNGSTAAGARGGGILAQTTGTGAFRIVNNTFVGQSVPQGNGGAAALDTSLGTSAASLVANSVFAGNAAAAGGGIDYAAFSGTIRNNDFHANPGGDLFDAGGSPAVLLDNTFVDPQFQGTTANPYRLAPGSPLIDTAGDDVAPADDRDAFPRPYDGNGDLLARADVGAHEFPAREIDGLRFAGAGLLEWDALWPLEAYNLYRGSLGRLRATGEYTQDPAVEPLAARFCGVLPAEIPFQDAFAPPPGEAVFYLATLTIGNWEGGLGPGPGVGPRPTPDGCP